MAWFVKTQINIKSPCSLHEDCRDKALSEYNRKLWVGSRPSPIRNLGRALKRQSVGTQEGKWVTNRNPAQKQLPSVMQVFSHAAWGGKDASFLNFHLWQQQAQYQCYVANHWILQQFSPYTSSFFPMNYLLSVSWSYWERDDGFPTRCAYTRLHMMGLYFLWGKHRTFLVTLAGTSAYVPLGQRSQDRCIKCAVQHYDASCDVVSITGIWLVVINKIYQLTWWG